jgi:hypothetical protein
MRSKTILALLLLSSGLAAEDKPRLVEARIKFVAAKQAIGGVGILQEKRLDVFMIPSDMLTETVVYRGPARLTLLQAAAVANPEAAKTKDDEKERIEKRSAVGSKPATKTHEYVASDKPPLAWIDLPADQGPLHLILLVNPGQGTGITAIADNPGSFPPGSNRYFNLCPFPIRIKLPSGEQFLPEKGAKVMRPGAPNADYYDLVITSKVGDQEQLAFSGRIFHLEDRRKLYLISPGAGETGRIRLKVIEDRPAYEKPPTTPPVAPKNLK